MGCRREWLNSGEIRRMCLEGWAPKSTAQIWRGFILAGLSCSIERWCLNTHTESPLMQTQRSLGTLTKKNIQLKNIASQAVWLHSAVQYSWLRPGRAAFTVQLCPSLLATQSTSWLTQGRWDTEPSFLERLWCADGESSVGAHRGGLCPLQGGGRCLLSPRWLCISPC